MHDLGEAVRGDVPAPQQTGDKTADERADLARCSPPLPAPAAARLLALWDEYNAVATPGGAARQGPRPAGDGADRMCEGANPPGFDYAFNLGYGRAHTDAHPLVAALREPVDAETARLAGQAE